VQLLEQIREQYLPAEPGDVRTPSNRAGRRLGFVISVVTPSLSVVIPVRDEVTHLPATIRALTVALEGSGFDAELIVVDDGSTDGSAEAARTSADGRVPLRIVSRAGEGRFEARRAGLEAARGELALLLDARVQLAPEALRFVCDRVSAGEDVWNGHVDVDANKAFGVFWRLLAELAWRDYFDEPRTTSFGADEFDRFPKGMGCFLAPRELLLSAFSTFRTRYRDLRFANDDTPVLRTVAARKRIGISPSFACVYAPRTTFGRFLRHAVHRGAVFVDGHGTPASRFFPVVVAFFPLSTALAVGAVRRPALVPAAAAACGFAAAVYGVHAGRSRRDVAVLATVTPIYALGHSVGMWRGAFELLRGAAAQ
jgi:glycosyltransferase involved in cell wall biosynthesis